MPESTPRRTLRALRRIFEVIVAVAVVVNFINDGVSLRPKELWHRVSKHLPHHSPSKTVVGTVLADDVHARTEPSLRVGAIAEEVDKGVKLTIDCQVKGPEVNPANGPATDVWDRTISGLWVSAAYLDTDSDNSTVPHCP